MARQFIYHMQGLTKTYPTRKVLETKSCTKSGISSCASAWKGSPQALNRARKPSMAVRSAPISDIALR